MTIAQIIGLVVVLILAILGGIFIVKKSTKHNLVKWIGLFFFVSIALTWIFSYGYYYNGMEFYDYGMYQQGLSDIPNMLYYAIGFASDKIIFLLVLGGFYALLTKCNGYKKLVSNIAEKFKGKELTFALIVSLLFTVMGSFFSQTFVALVFVPFVISILLSMKLDKITAFCVTFGSILIGLLGVTYGKEGFSWFNKYTNLTMSTGLTYRLLILVTGFILFNFFTLFHAKKTLKNKVNEIDVDPFKVEKEDKKSKVWPFVLLFGIMFVLMVLGYINWSDGFNIDVFNKFHEWLTTLTFGQIPVIKYIDKLIKGFGDLRVFAPLLGVGSAAFGLWDLFHMTMILILASIIIAIFNKIKFSELITSYGEGFKKVSKPILIYVLAYAIMSPAYLSPYVPTITNMLFKGATELNPLLLSLDGLVAGIFHVDLAYSGYVVAPYLVNTFSADASIVHTVFTLFHGFAGLFIPSSGVLVLGLSYLDIDYKTWIKYIWMFVIGILIILAVLIAIMVYL